MCEACLILSMVWRNSSTEGLDELVRRSTDITLLTTAILQSKQTRPGELSKVTIIPTHLDTVASAH